MTTICPSAYQPSILRILLIIAFKKKPLSHVCLVLLPLIDCNSSCLSLYTLCGSGLLSISLSCYLLPLPSSSESLPPPLLIKDWKQITKEVMQDRPLHSFVAKSVKGDGLCLSGHISFHLLSHCCLTLNVLGAGSRTSKAACQWWRKRSR